MWRKIALGFLISFFIPYSVFAVYTRTPSGITTSTNFTLNSTNPAGDFAGWNGSGNSWRYTLGRVGVTDGFDVYFGSCHGNATGSDTLTAAYFGFATGTKVGGLQFRQFTSNNCTTGALNNGVIEGIDAWWVNAPTSSIWEWNELSTSTSATSSYNLCMSSTTDQIVGNTFILMQFLILSGVFILVAYGAYKFFKH